MAKRKVEAEVAIEVTGADDLAKVEDRAGALADGTDVPIEVQVDDDKLSKFERELDSLDLESGRELRIEFRAQLLQAEIRKALRDLERLEDPIQIATRTEQLDQAQRDLRDLAELADRKYDVEVRVDTRGTARQAADQLDRMGASAEGIQRGIGPLRGFTDELGAAGAAGGVAANAIVDAGEAVEVFGSQLGLSTRALAGISAALGGIGIAVGAGVAAWKSYRDAQKETREQIRNTSQALADQIPILDELAAAASEAAERSSDPFIRLAEVLRSELDAGQLETLNAALEDLGLTYNDLDETIAGLQSDRVGFLASELERLGATGPVAMEIAEQLERVDSFSGLLGGGGLSIDAAQTVVELESMIKALLDLKDAADSTQARSSVEALLTEITVRGDEASQVLADVRANLAPDADAFQVYEQFLIQIREVAEAQRDVGDAGTESAAELAAAAGLTEQAWRSMNERLTESQRFGATWSDAMVGYLGEVEAAADDTVSAFAGLLGEVDTEQTILALADGFDRVAEARAKAAEAAGTEDEEKALRNYRREQLRLIEDTVAYLDTLEDLPPERVTQIAALIDRGELAAAEAAIDALTADRELDLTIRIREAVSDQLKTISVRVQPDAAPTQVATVYQPPQVVNIYNPPGTPAATADTVRIDQARNGSRGPY